MAEWGPPACAGDGTSAYAPALVRFGKETTIVVAQISERPEIREELARIGLPRTADNNNGQFTITAQQNAYGEAAEGAACRNVKGS